MPRPVLVAPIGLPGAGKTTLLDALDRRLGPIARVSRYALRMELAGAPAYSDAEKQAILEEMLHRAGAHLAAGRDVALDGATFSRQADRDAVAGVARRHGAALVMAWCFLEPDVAARRIAADPGHSAGDRTPALPEAVAARFDPVGPGLLRLDMTRPVDDLAAALAAAVAAARLDPAMPQLIERPSVVEAAGTPPKVIEEFVGRVNTGEQRLSVARMRSPAGWGEPGQRPAFDEYTLVLAGCLRVESEGGAVDVRPGQAVLCRAGEWIRYSSPEPEGAEYVAICLPAFSPDTVHRDGDEAGA